MVPKRTLKNSNNAHEEVVKEIKELWKEQKKKENKDNNNGR